MPSARPTNFALTAAGALRFYSTQELLTMRPPRWLVHQLVPEGAFMVLYGPSGVGKSFVAIDIALSVASGLIWQGRTTEPGFVLYVSAEGTAGLGQRIKAWLRHKKLEAPDADIAWLPEAVAMHSDSEHVDILFERFEELGRAPALLIVDTLARCFDGNENETQDMSRFIQGIDRIRHTYGSTVIAVHHTNVSEGRERGNSALRAASDTMVRMLPGILGASSSKMSLRAPQGTFSIVIDKQKDALPGPVGLGRLLAVEGTTSCVPTVEWVNEEDLP